MNDYKLYLSREIIPCNDKEILEFYRTLLDVNSDIVPLGCYREQGSYQLLFSLFSDSDNKIYVEEITNLTHDIQENIISRLVARVNYEHDKQ